MKTVYIVDGKQFESVIEAQEYEEKVEAEKKAAAELKAKKKERLDQIKADVESLKDRVNQFNKDYPEDAIVLTTSTRWSSWF